jgi:hypothetical protein
MPIPFHVNVIGNDGKYHAEADSGEHRYLPISAMIAKPFTKTFLKRRKSSLRKD